MSLVEMTRITGVEDRAEGGVAIRELSARPAIGTDGPRGGWVDHDDFVGHIPTLKADTIVSTGAGDSFTGGVLTGLNHGLGAKDAARLGAAMGALHTTTIDTFTGPDDPADAWPLAGLELR